MPIPQLPYLADVRLAAQLRRHVETAGLFWLEHSMDPAGGAYSCLDRDGLVFSADKFTWGLSRQLSAFVQLMNADIPDAARFKSAAANLSGFLTKLMELRPGRVPFRVTVGDDATTVFRNDAIAEILTARSLVSYGRSTGNELTHSLGKDLLVKCVSFVLDGNHRDMLGLASASPISLVHEMALLDALQDLQDIYSQKSAQEALVVRLTERFRNGLPGMVEYPAAPSESVEASLINTGHALEVLKILLRDARQSSRVPADWLIEGARAIFAEAWDEVQGGLATFVDAKRQPVVKLDACLRMWWVHLEGAVTLYLLWLATGQDDDRIRFEAVLGYALDVFPDPQCDEWFGYALPDRSIPYRFKGSAFKGFDHLPSALLELSLLMSEPSSLAERDLS